MSKKQTMVERYMAETFMYGGDLCTRAEIIADLKAMGGSQRQIDMYLFGLDRQKDKLK